MKNLAGVAFLTFFLLCSFGQPDAIATNPTAQIKVEPSTTVEVGEEVLFDATGSVDDKPLVEGKFEWQFGDGYTLMEGYPYYYIYDGGITCSHFYMQPGTYTVTLTVTDIDGNQDTDTKTMTVIMSLYGPPKTDNIELLHANFHGHIAQYIYARIADTATQTAKIKAMIKGDNGYEQVIHQSPASAGEEIKFLLRNSLLPAGNYYLIVQLLDSSDGLVDQVSEKFSKPYDGIPHVGIDENNAICIDGVPFFPVTPFIVTEGYEMNHYAAAKLINSLYAEGWYPGHDLDTWKDYLNEGSNHDLYVIGPNAYWMTDVPARKFMRNADINNLVNYVTETKNYPALLMWAYVDEPSLGGWGAYTPPPVLRSWTYKTHQLDSQHLVAVNFYGYSYLPGMSGTHYTMMNKYSYYGDESLSIFGNAEEFGGKRQHVVDVNGFDIYPVEFGVTMERYAVAIDNLIGWNYNLIPAMSFIETQDIGQSAGSPYAPTAEQIRMENWLNVVHGIKGINWFPLFKPRPAENDGAMAEFVRQITALTPVVLGPEPERGVVDNANVWGNRIDTMLREDSENIYIFAVRITEVDRSTGGPHPDDVGDRTVTFTVEGLTDNTIVYEPAEFMKISYENHGTPAGGRYFNFNTNAPITPGTLLVAGKINEEYFGWRFFFDNGDGTLYALNSGMTGTVNYETGQVYADFGTSNNIYAGEEYVRAMYQPNRTDRIVGIITGNTFTDTFAPNDVHIYRIPKEPATEPIISVTPAYGINFGNVNVGEYKDETFTVKNVGVGILEGTASVDAPFSIISGGSYSLSAGESQDVVVRFTLAEAGSVSSTITFTGADGATRTLSGTGVIVDTEAPTVPTNLAATVISTSQINVSWNASTDNVRVLGYKIYRDGVMVATSATISHSDTGLSPSTTYTYRVSAYDAAGNESDKSTPVSATTLADTTPPSIVSVTPQETSVNIVFSEPINKSSAERKENYNINDGIISIIQASLSVDLVTVTLTTSSHTDGLTYTLTVEDVKDTALNPIQPTQIDYVYRADVTDGLIAHWKLDEGTGTIAQDSSGNGHDGTLINGPVWTTEGRINYALDFDGSNDKVTIPHHDDLDPELITVAAWVYLEQSKAWSAVLTKDEQVSYWLGVGGTTPIFLLSPDGSSGRHIIFWADSGMTLNTWHHIAATYDGNYVQLYIDGSSSGSPQDYNGGIYQGTSQVLIGDSITWQTFSNAFNGIIDDVRIYNRALSQEEIQSIYYAAPIPQYTFDSSLEGWSFLSLSGLGFSGASSGYSGGRISISSASDTTNRVGFWIGPLDIPCLAGNVYRARFLVSSSEATASANPQFRMRWFQDQALESASHVVNASAPHSNSLPTDPTQREYPSYFAPIFAYKLGVAFDMLDFDVSQYGTHYVDQVTVDRFPRPGSSTAVKTYTDSTDFANWSFLPGIGGYGPVTSGGAGTGTLSITSSLANFGNSGFWQSSATANELTYVADKLYRATYTLSATDAARNTMPQVRLRCQSEDGQMTAAMELNSQGLGGPGAMPALAGTDYEVYWETPTLPGSPTASQDGFVVTIDMLDFDTAKGGTIYMDGVAIDYLTIP